MRYLSNKIARLAIIVLITVVVCMVIIFFVSKNMRSSLTLPENLQSQKIRVYDPVTIAYKGITVSAPNNDLNRPSYVVATQDGKILWEQELGVPDIDSRLEKDVQVAKHFITDMKITLRGDQDVIFVSKGSGDNQSTFSLDPETGEVLHMYIANSPLKNYEEEIKIVQKWTGIKSLPSWSKDLSVEVKGSEFSREFVVTFSGSKEQIESWMKTEPALKDKDIEFKKVSDTYYKYILPAKDGAQFAEVLIDYSLNKVTIHTYWS